VPLPLIVRSLLTYCEPMLAIPLLPETVSFAPAK
jgi:hypothetical protein